MLKSIQQRDLDRNRWIKISMTVILVLICVSMVITLIPGLFSGPATDASSPDAAAVVGGQTVSIVDVQQRLDQMSRGQTIPQMMRGLYAREVLNQMIFQRAMDYEAQRLSMDVTPEEERQRIQQILPTAFSNGVWLKDQYVNQVENQLGMSVPQFEEALRESMITEKFRHLVTDGITVGPAEIQEEFRRRNEKIAIQYALVKPAEIASTIQPTEDQLSTYFKQNMAKYQIPEKRAAQYALLDLSKLRAQTQIPDDALKAYYNQHLADYKVANSVHVEHILFKTIGKTDAEVAEIKKQAESVLKQAKSGANFEALAKKYSEDDASKVKGGDLGWIVEGQTVPEFQQVAFNLPKGSISDLVKTQYGFHIIKVLDKQTAHTKTFEEVRSSILPILLDQKVNDEADNIASQMADIVRQSDRQPVATVAKKLNLELGSTPPISISDPVGELGSSHDVSQMLFELRVGELSAPLHIDKGYVIITPSQVVPAHQATLAEVHARVLSDYQQEKSQELARAKADDLFKRAQGGEAIDKTAKALGLQAKNSDAFSRTGSVPEVGSADQIQSAFGMSVGQVSQPKQVGGNWLVYRVVAHQSADPADFAKQKSEIEQQILQSKQQAAFDAFKTALEDRLKQEGKLSINPSVVQRLTNQS
ncbi:MAG TPA: peptidyl-prolyl cis-trans isomerase [Candidatus Acidoferrales bacterium]|nr:peptidyl-prolyl cis-trans isomerase [Candidatus Acidoferrales bacterium]